MKNIPNSQKGDANLLVLIFFLLFVASAGTAIYFWRGYTQEVALSRAAQKVANQPTPNTKPTPTPAAPTEAFPNRPVDTLATVPAAELPVIVYTPTAQFEAPEMLEIRKMFIDPFTHWNKDNKITTVSINIEKPYPAIAGYRYKITYINAGGSNGGFLYGASIPLEWWLPECMGEGCAFSDSFKAKYPAIVAKFQ